MLREIQNSRTAIESGRRTDNMDKKAAVLSASAQGLPSSDEEENLFDSGCSDVEDNVSSTTRQPLRRLHRVGTQSTALLKRSAEVDEELLNSISALGLGPRSLPVPAQPSDPLQPPTYSNTPIVASADKVGISSSSNPSDRDDSIDNSSSEDDYEPFFERQKPTLCTQSEASSKLPAGRGPLLLEGPRQYMLPEHVSQTLFEHQVQGVKWLWSLFAMQKGGILGDDMGLGKTMQCSAFLAGLFHSNLVRRAIIIAPKTLLPHWIKELSVCGLSSRTKEYFGTSESERIRALNSTLKGTGILVTTYGMVQHNSRSLAGPVSSGQEDFVWDVMLLDEGHKIKNPKMKLVEQLRTLPARMRVIISGTPIQNNLMEMHSLFDFCTEGLLGDSKTFKKKYERPITKGLDKEASARDRQTGAAIAAELRNRIEPFFLRREKKDVLTNKSSGGSADASGAAGPSNSASTATAEDASTGQRAKGLPRKNDLVVWLRITPLQRKLYESFLNTESVKAVLNEKASPLAAITVLKKICDHPGLLSQRATNNVIGGADRWARNGQGLSRGRRRDSMDDFIVDTDEDSTSDGEFVSDDDGSDDKSPQNVGNTGGDGDLLDGLVDGHTLDAALTREMEQRPAEASCKTVFVLSLLDQLHSEGHRTLIFSQSKVMLNVLEAGIKAKKMAYCRIDGDVATAEERQAIVQRFQLSKTIPVFLLTSQVGGLGLTLTAADRVIIVDPAWNPSIDNQSVDRAYRIGQTRDVVVYRVMTCGTVEEKIYRKQVFKGGLSRTGTEEGIQFRYFTETDLKDLFKVSQEGLERSMTQEQLHSMHGQQRNATVELERHLEQVQGMKYVAGIHDHDLLFTQKPDEPSPTAEEGAALLSQMSGSGLVGVDALANMLGTGLQLGSGAATKKLTPVEQASRNVSELKSKLDEMQKTFRTMQLKLPDRGVKLLKQMDALHSKLEQAVAELSVLEANASAQGTDTLPRQGDALSSSRGLASPVDSPTADSGVSNAGGASTGVGPMAGPAQMTASCSSGGVPTGPVRSGGFGAGLMFRKNSAGRGITDGNVSGLRAFNVFSQFAAPSHQTPGEVPESNRVEARVHRSPLQSHGDDGEDYVSAQSNGCNDQVQIADEVTSKHVIDITDLTDSP